jgi:demethylmenaquinone methyltransferase/2-methoxy-6-polyprenyl-1,4-benzoquinol methylase
MSGSKETSISQVERLRIIFRLTEPAVRQAVHALRIPRGSRGLDGGCGAGCHLEMLSEQIGSTGRLTAFDLAFDNLAAAHAAYVDEGAGAELGELGGSRARTRVRARPEVDFIQGDICRVPFEKDIFDWIWCADTLWAGTSEEGPEAVVAELARVTRPGGKLAFLYWSSQSLLPGYAGLEARLQAAFVGSAPYLAGVAPEHQHLRALGWLREAGLRRPRAKTFLAEIRGPVDGTIRQALAVCFDMFWGDLEGEVSAEDWHAYRRLCSAESPDFVGDDRGYYGFITYTMFWGAK